MHILNYGNQFKRGRLSTARAALPTEALQAAERDQALPACEELFQGEIKVTS